MADKFFVWGTIYNGGKSTEGRDGRKLISERNIVEPGTEVTASKLGLDKDEFQHLVDTGTIRNYPLPKNMRDGESPTQAVMRGVLNRDGEISQDMMLELALSHPPVGALHPDEEQEANLPVGA